MTAPAHAPAAGRLLVATPSLVDPNFDHTVVLLLDVDDGGALGVVLNRRSGMGVGEILPDWSDACSSPQVVFRGGPVAMDSALAVALLAEPAQEPVGFRRSYGGVGVVDLDTPTEVLAPAVRAVRVFAGYAGWGSGQLDAEIEEGAWVVVESLPEDVFGPAVDDLWTTVLRRQPGELAWLTTRPVDPELK
jgi:putative transcriptional regulator